LICLGKITSVKAIGPVTIGITALAGGTIYQLIKCRYIECCSEPWVRSSPEILNGLERNLSNQLYGQPFSQLIFKAIKRHVSDPSPIKALVMSFHGGPGTGKNYAMEIVRKALFFDRKTQYFVKISATDKFPEKDALSIRKYREELKEIVVKTLQLCKYAVFAIDEVHKMPPGVLDILSPFFDYGQEKVSDVEKHHAIFIFLSNTGSSEIAKFILDMLSQGKLRSSLTPKDMEKMINTESFNQEDQGFYGSDIMAKQLIDHYIAFLPLEKKHVKLCMKDYIQAKYGSSRMPPGLIQKVIDELEYWPADTQVYSRTGCKRVDAKVNALWVD
jgi:hypothetical protein